MDTESARAAASETLLQTIGVTNDARIALNNEEDLDKAFVFMNDAIFLLEMAFRELKMIQVEEEDIDVERGYS
jgi:hypothetical protein